MDNEDIIRRLLKFVKYQDGILQVLSAPERWIALADWCSQCTQFSAYRLDSINSIEQTTQLRDYFYATFYMLGRSDFNQPEEPAPIPKPSLPDVSLDNRPKLNDEAIIKFNLVNGKVIVEQATTRFTLSSGKYIDEEKPERFAKIFNPSVKTDESGNEDNAGWCFTDSTQPGFNFENQRVRFYLHPYPDHTSAVARLLINYLDEYRVPFQLKYLDRFSFPDRCDRIVLYISQQHFVIVSWAILHVYAIGKNSFLDRLPLFVKPVLKGIGLAEDPFDGESFGKIRCMWISYAIIQWVAGLPKDSSATPPAEEIIASILENQQLSDLEHIHLNPGSIYPYNFGLFESNSFLKVNKINNSFWLQGAIDIANFLCREVAWVTVDQGIWIGTEKGSGGRPVNKPLEIDWEKGILGPVLFLHTLNKYSTDPLYEFIIKHNLPDLKERLAETDETISSALLQLYDYQKQSPFLSFFYTLKIFPLQLVKKRKYMKRVTFSPSLVKIQKGPLEQDKDRYEDLLAILKARTQTSSQLPKEFCEILTQIQENSRAYFTNEKGWDNFIPGMNGLTLLGFSYLLAHDPLLPPIPVGNL